MSTIVFIIDLIIFLGIPLAILIFFIVSLVRFCKTPKDAPARGGRKVALIISAVLFGLLAAFIVFLAVGFTAAMNHM
ncbi:MAG: hypothetical protein IKH78_02490 [Ruminococcus sp.]|nr:hypothetical protein [Ruminococcus sp.]